MFSIHNLTLRHKFFLLLSLLLTAIGLFSWTLWGLGQANEAIFKAHEQRYLSYKLADELRQSSDDLTRLARTYVVSGDSRWEAQYMEILDIRNGKKPRPAGIQGIYWDFRAVDIHPPGQPGEAVPLLDLMRRAGFTQAELNKLAEAARNSDDLINTEVVAMNLVKGLVPDGKGGFEHGEPDLEKARDLMHNAAYHRFKAKIMAPVNEFFQLLDERTRGAIRAAETSAQSWKLFAVGSAVVTLGLFLAVFHSVFGQIIRSFRRAVAATEVIAGGDLTQHVESRGRDEAAQLLRSLETMRSRLIDVVSRVRQGSEAVASASAEIGQGNLDLSNRTESQASALQETAASMDELSSTVAQNADSAQQANQLAQSASAVAVQGGQAVAEVVDTMKHISESSRKIAEIINVIDGIAFQTNILALNAAVEAARAGEQGRGFAVVAGEVRSLAGRSASAAREIKELITSSVSQVGEGTRRADEAGRTMEEVVASIRRVTDIVGEISAASTEQSAGVRQITSAVTQIDQSTQQNAALVEQMAAATGSLSKQAQNLVQTVALFKLDQKGTTRKSIPAPVATTTTNKVPSTATAATTAIAAPAAPATSQAQQGPASAPLSAPATPARPVPKQSVPDNATAVDSAAQDEWETF